MLAAAVLMLMEASVCASSEKTINLAFVLLSKPGLPSAQAVAAAFSRFAVQGQYLKIRDSEGSTGDGEILQFDAGGCGAVFVAAVPVPVPKGEADEGVRFSVSAFGTEWRLPPHAAHLIVTASGNEAPSKAAALSSFTSVLAAVTVASHAVGVYWGSAGATHSPDFFVSVAEERDPDSRILLWTGVSLAREADGRLSLLSLGMQQLGLPDLLLVAPKSTAGNAALGTFFDLLNYTAKRGEALREGDTVGRTAKEKLPVTYVASPVDPDKQVWRVEIR